MIEFRDALVDAGDGGRLESAMRVEMSELYGGFDIANPHMPVADASVLNPPAGLFLVGYEDGVAICCGGIKRLAADICEFKRMYVVPAARGKGVARTLLGALEDRARALGYAVGRLDTGPKQPAAQHLYESAGYRQIENFNANPVATFFGEKPL